MHELILALISVIPSLFGIAGGGGSGGGGGGGGGSGGSFNGPLGGALFNYILVSFVILIVLVFYSTIRSLRAHKVRREKTRLELAVASLADPLWNQQSLIGFANSIFLRHQKDWSAFNVESMKQYMAPAYLSHTQLMLVALQEANRQNQVDNIKILSTEIVDVSDSGDNAQDHFGAVIEAQVDDIINNTALGKQIHKEEALDATQTYKFQRSGDTWLFSGIDQSTASTLTYNAELEKFAAANKFCYSVDWGWLLLPESGQLFGSGEFGSSDINNHIIGMYNNVLIQLYTYKPYTEATKSYLIAQTSVPKSYGDIVVRRRHTGMNFKIRGLNKLSTEWEDFNKKYDVFASNTEQATSFELLNPLFMEKLETLPFEVNIEVVDNVVYLYADEQAKGTTSSQDDASRYGTMLEVLKAAFKEMRM